MGDGGLSLVQPEPGDERAAMLASFVASGDFAGVRRVLQRDPGAVNEPGLDGTSPLCAASMWGNDAMLRLLLSAMASPNVRNESGPGWTALHAAALQEHGKSCMLLLEGGALPTERDAEGVSPLDYASCSEAVWPFFAVRGCDRVDKATLVQKGVLRRASSRLEQELAGDERGAAGGAGQRRGVVAEYSRPGSAYVVSREFPPRPGSAMPPRSGGTGSSRHGGPSRQSIDILEEEELGEGGGGKEAAHSSAESGLRALVA